MQCRTDGIKHSIDTLRDFFFWGGGRLTLICCLMERVDLNKRHYVHPDCQNTKSTICRVTATNRLKDPVVTLREYWTEEGGEVDLNF